MPSGAIRSFAARSLPPARTSMKNRRTNLVLRWALGALCPDIGAVAVAWFIWLLSRRCPSRSGLASIRDDAAGVGRARSGHTSSNRDRLVRSRRSSKSSRGGRPAAMGSQHRSWRNAEDWLGWGAWQTPAARRGPSRRRRRRARRVRPVSSRRPGPRRAGRGAPRRPATRARCGRHRGRLRRDRRWCRSPPRPLPTAP
jgi:hypothetical protein